MKITKVGLRDQVVDMDDGTSVVMVGTHVVALSPLATEVLTLLESGPRDETEVVAHLRGTFGEPGDSGDATTLVRDLVRDLRKHRVVHVVKSR